MNIRPRNIPKFDGGGVTGVKWKNGNGGGWYTDVFSRYSENIIDELLKFGEGDDFMNWLNKMLSNHSKLHKNAGSNFQNFAYSDDSVKRYLTQYSGRDSINNINFNKLGIEPNQSSRYDTSGRTRTSGDFNRDGHYYDPDGYYSAITDDRRLLGRFGDFDDSLLTDFKNKLNSIGFDIYRDSDDYYKLKRIQKTPPVVSSDVSSAISPTIPEGGISSTLIDLNKLNSAKSLLNTSETGVDPKKMGGKSNWWKNIAGAIGGLLPNILEGIRLAGNLNNNLKVYDIMKKLGVALELAPLYHTQILGNEGTKQSYYRRAAQGQTKAAQPITSDLDRLLAYLMEYKGVGDELRAQGDLADNLRIRETSLYSLELENKNKENLANIGNRNNEKLTLLKNTMLELEAGKHSADWTSWDNWLKGLATDAKYRQKEDLALADQITVLTESQRLNDDDEIKDLLERKLEILKRHTILDESGIQTIDYSSPEVQDILKEERKLLNRKTIESLLRRRANKGFGSLWGISYAKEGTKVTRKRKDDLLYKSTKDAVDHFRKIYKMTDDSKKPRTKISEVKGAPKRHTTRKMLLGGVAPFTIYTPVVLGGEVSTTSGEQTNTKKSSSSDSKKDTLDMVKELFKTLQGLGLPSDVRTVYLLMLNMLDKVRYSGLELSTEDISSMYLLSMMLLNTVKYLREKLDKALELVTTNKGLNEFAVTSDGMFAVLDKLGKDIRFATLQEIQENKNLNPLTNYQLLQLRAYDPSLAFNSNIAGIVSNGVGMEAIADKIKSLIPNIGTTELIQEGYTQHLAGQIVEGFKALAEAPEGDYKVTNKTKSQEQQISAAMDYVMRILPPNMKSILAINSVKRGLNVPTLIQDMIGTGSFTSDLQFTAVTGKASDKDNGIEINSAVLMLLGMSSPREFTFSIGNGNSFQGLARVSRLEDKNGNSFGADFSYSNIYKSGLSQNLDLDNASFGDIPINKTLKDHIIVDNSTIAGIDLPYTIDKNGRIIPDFLMLNKIEEADLEILRAGIDPTKDPLKANAIYTKHNLPIKYDSNNQLTGNYKRFAVILATAIEDVFLNKDGLASNGTLELVSDDEEKQKYLRELAKNTGQKEIDLDRPGWFNFGKKDIYKGAIFIPIIGDLTDAITGGGSKLTSEDYDKYRELWNTRN